MARIFLNICIKIIEESYDRCFWSRKINITANLKKSLFTNFHFQVAVVGFVAADDADFNAAGDMFDDVPFGVLDADAAKALDVAEGKIALLKQVIILIPTLSG